MATSYRLSFATHILVHVCLAQEAGRPCTSADIARSLAANPSQVRQTIGKLREAGMLSTEQGRPCTTIARPAEEISLLDVYRAVEGDNPLLHLNTCINPSCGVGQNVQLVIGRRYERIQRLVEEEMAGCSLRSLVDEYRESAGSQAHRAWLD